MRKDAEMHADEDKKRKELIEARNQARQYAYTAEKLIKDYTDKIAETTELEGKIQQVRGCSG